MNNARLLIVLASVFTGAYNAFCLCRAYGNSAAFITLFLILFVASTACILVPALSRTGAGKAGYLWLCVSIYLSGFLAVRDCAMLILNISGAAVGTFGYVSLYIAFAATAIVMSKGIYNAYSVKTVNYTVPSVGGDVSRIAVFSDLHLGRTVGIKHVERVVERLRSLGCDMILFAGDMFTGHPQEVAERYKAAEIFASLSPKYGFYACGGNHDIPSPELSDFFERAYIRLLSDECVTAGGFRIAGRTDIQRARKDGEAVALTDVLSRSGADGSLPLIVLDHEPVRTDEARDAGCSLLFCGHTHRGQLFPANLLTKLRYGHDYGIKRFGDTTVVVSCGAGQWGPPVRTGSRVEICVISLKKS